MYTHLKLLRGTTVFILSPITLMALACFTHTARARAHTAAALSATLARVCVRRAKYFAVEICRANVRERSETAGGRRAWRECATRAMTKRAREDDAMRKVTLCWATARMQAYLERASELWGNIGADGRL